MCRGRSQVGSPCFPLAASTVAFVPRAHYHNAPPPAIAVAGRFGTALNNVPISLQTPPDCGPGRENSAMCKTRQLAVLSSLTAILAAGLCVTPALAQLRFQIRHAPRPLEIEAVAGEPFGVGRITFELPQDKLPEPLGIEGIGLGEKHGRVLYPTLDNPALRQNDEGIPRRRNAAHLRRTGARGGGGHFAGDSRPAAADHPLLPLPRRRAAGTIA